MKNNEVLPQNNPETKPIESPSTVAPSMDNSSSKQKEGVSSQNNVAKNPIEKSKENHSPVNEKIGKKDSTSPQNVPSTKPIEESKEDRPSTNENINKQDGTLSQNNPSTQPIEQPKSNSMHGADKGSVVQIEEVKALGFGVDIPRRNIAQHDKQGNPLPPYYPGEERGTAEPYAEISSHPKSTNNEPFTASEKYGFENISLDIPYSSPTEVLGNPKTPYSWYEGKKGRIYYRAENTAKALPVNQVVSYKGIWRFVTDARPFTKDGKVRDGYEDFEGRYGYIGNHDGATSYDEYIVPGSGGGHYSEFTADFNTKKLTGKLIKSDDAKSGIDRYAIEADIKDNRFYGKAKALDKSNKGVKYFHANSDKLEGGFYGTHANELAGSFLANDNSVFAIFGAKANKEMLNDIMVDSFKVNIEDNEDFVKSDLNSYLDLSKLVIDGQEIPLADGETTLSSGDKVSISTCCGDLKSVKFGTFIHKSSRHKPIEEEIEEEEIVDDSEIDDEELADTDFLEEGSEEADEDVETNPNLKLPEDLVYTPFGKHLFIQGHRTSTKDLPKEQIFTYEGRWQGQASGKKIAPVNFSPDASKATFTANFADKKVTGELKRHNDTNPIVLVDANIEKNGFKGEARTGEFGIVLDAGNVLDGAKRINFSKAVVEGAFYGKHAEEIGGSIYSQEPKFGAVFGGKKVENKEK